MGKRILEVRVFQNSEWRFQMINSIRLSKANVLCWLAIISLSFAVVGCGSIGSDDEPTDDDGWVDNPPEEQPPEEDPPDEEPPEEEPPEEKPPEEPPSEEPEAAETTFQLENTGARKVFIEKVGSCKRSPEPAWMDIRRDSSPLQLSRRCGPCKCSELEEGEGCRNACPMARCMPAPRKQAIPAGESVEWTWDGKYIEHQNVDGTTCTKTKPVKKDASLSVEFCWFPTKDGSETCETVDFDYGQDRVHQQLDLKKDEPERQPKPALLKLNNESGEDVELTALSSCTQDRRGWASISRAGPVPLNVRYAPIKLPARCRPCVQRTEVGGRKVTLEDGDSRRLKWNGRLKSRGCGSEMIPEKGTELKVTFCWFEPGDRSAKTCEDATLEYGNKKVVSATIPNTTKPEGASKTAFTLENNTNRRIRFRDPTCRAPESPTWLSVLKGGQNQRLDGDSCTSCRCENVQRGRMCRMACPSCERPPEPVYRELEPGQKAGWAWDGFVYERSSKHGQQCIAKELPPKNGEYTAKFCYEYRATTRGPQKWKSECKTKSFDYGQKRVRKVLGMRATN
jgi:hypothetical protein